MTASVFLLAVATVAAPAQPVSLDLPACSQILVNGRFGSDEWQQAARTSLGGGVELRACRDDRYLYLGFVFTDPKHTGIDLFLAADGRPIAALHVSSALGDRRWEGDHWGDMVWGENREWTANAAGSIFEEGTTRFLFADGFELQIATSMLPGKHWSLAAQLKRPNAVVPAGADLDEPSTWLRLAG
jgi:hypothetical protein